MTWGEWLDKYKASVSHDCVLVLSRFALMQQLCVGWRNAEVKFPYDDLIPEDCEDYKSEAWELSDYNPVDVADKGGFSVGSIKLLMRQAVAIDMVFPDGSLNDAATKVLSAIIAKQIRAVAQ